jgi:hypothetical protein
LKAVVVQLLVLNFDSTFTIDVIDGISPIRMEIMLIVKVFTTV